MKWGEHTIISSFVLTPLNGTAQLFKTLTLNPSLVMKSLINLKITSILLEYSGEPLTNPLK